MNEAKRTALFGIVLFLGLPAAAAQRTRAPAVPGRYIVKFRDSLADRVTLWVQENEADAVAPGLVPGLHTVELTPDEFTTFVGRTQNDFAQDVEYIHPDYYLFLHQGAPTDTDFEKQWALEAAPVSLNTGTTTFTPFSGADMEALEAWKIFGGTGKTTVAVVDSGITTNLHEFEGTLWKQGDQIGHDFITGSGVLFDSDYKGHGTSVAALIGARSGTAASEDIVGVDPGCSIMPLRTFKVTLVSGTQMQASATSDIILALGFAAKFGARVVNNSYGAEAIQDAQGLEDAIDALRVKGILFVCSAGNGNLDIDVDPFYPASFDLDNMIVVTSTTPQDKLGGNRNTGKATVDLAAPGEHIYGPKGQWGGYGWFSGTSYATAHVSGAAALVWDFRPGWGYADVKGCILTSVRKLPALSGKVATGGVLNLKQMMQCAK